MKLFITIYLTIVCLATEAFTHSNTSTLQSQSVKSIKIGLLITDHASVDAKHAAEMAIDKANKESDQNDPRFQLITRSMEGSWGTGSKQAVDLIFKEDVWALLGSHDGRNAHLVEQVAAKTRTMFLSAWTTDPTLSQAFVPWYFSCVLNDTKQTSELIEEIYNKRKIIKTAIVSGRDYDSESSLQTFLKEAKASGKTVIEQLYLDDGDQNFNNLLRKIDKAEIEGIVLFGRPSVSRQFIRQLRLHKMNQPVFSTLALLGEDNLNQSELFDFENVVFAFPENWSHSKESSFQNEFRKRYGRLPSAVAAFAYDGMNCIIGAVRRSRFDRDRLLPEMFATLYQGVTGTIQFDDKGNRTGDIGLFEIKNGIQVAVKK